MDLDQFWNIVDGVKKSQEPEVAIERHLKRLSPDELISYQNHFEMLRDRAYRWDLWGAAYIMQGGCSDDGFIDFRAWLISKGREVYENALNNPDSLADLKLSDDEEPENELFGAAALMVYIEMTGNEMPVSSNGAIAEPTGPQWDFDDEEENATRLPKLTAKYAEVFSSSDNSVDYEHPARNSKPWWKFW